MNETVTGDNWYFTLISIEMNCSGGHYRAL